MKLSVLCVSCVRRLRCTLFSFIYLLPPDLFRGGLVNCLEIPRHCICHYRCLCRSLCRSLCCSLCCSHQLAALPIRLVALCALRCCLCLCLCLCCSISHGPCTPSTDG